MYPWAAARDLCSHLFLVGSLVFTLCKLLKQLNSNDQTNCFPQPHLDVMHFEWESFWDNPRLQVLEVCFHITKEYYKDESIDN